MRRRGDGGERDLPRCERSVAELVIARREALALCVERGWPASKVYDALQELGGGGAVSGGGVELLKRPPRAVPLDVRLDAQFRAQVAALEREARLLDEVSSARLPYVDRETGEIFGLPLADWPGSVGLGLSPQERTVAAIEWKYRATKPRRSGKKARNRL